jgi:hypothetical protein
VCCIVYINKKSLFVCMDGCMYGCMDGWMDSEKALP